MSNLSLRIPLRIDATVLRVSTVASATLPIRSYFIWLVSKCLSAVVSDFAPLNESPDLIASADNVSFCSEIDVVYCSIETYNSASIASIAFFISSLLSNETV